MQKIQSIMCLFCFLIVLFSMDLLFGNPLRETFKGIKNTTNEYDNMGTNNIDNKDMDININSDDEPLHFGFLAK